MPLELTIPRTSLTAGVLLWAALVAVPAPGARAGQQGPGGSGASATPVGPPEVLELTRLNGTYTQLAPEMVPVQRGGVTITLSSPEHELHLTDSRLTLTPLSDGSHQALLELEFAGRGILVADLAVSGAGSQLEDELEVPRQRRTLSGRVRIVRSQEDYLVTTEALQETFEVEIKSRLGGQLVAACKPLSVLALMALDCDGLERVFSQVAVPLPAPGETYIVEGARFSPEVRSRLDAYLARTDGAASP